MTEETIFLAVIDILDPQARSQYLDDACGGNLPLRRQIDALVAAHEKNDDFLNVPVGEQLWADPPSSAGAASTLSFASAGKRGIDFRPARADQDTSTYMPRSADEPVESVRQLMRSVVLSPQVTNRFQILEELGQGGMGVVFRALDNFQGGQEVAMKIIRRGSVLQFQEEFRTLTRLRHPNLVEVYDYGSFDSHTQFFTMELVRGVSLATLKANRLPLPTVYPIVIQLLHALEFIHSRSYLHRDIKPGNIVVRADGTLKLLDFGLMQSIGTLSGGTVSGTPAYMAPEVLRGEVLGIPSDLYSVGCLTYEVLVGKPPFLGTTDELFLKHLHASPPALRDLLPDAPAQLEAILLRLLAKNPRERHQTSAEVVLDLADLAGICVGRQNLEQKRSYLMSSVLVGRDGELHQLLAALSDANVGKGGGVWIGAPAGVGKSRLSHELIVQAKLKDMVVVQARGAEGGMAPFELITDALRPLLAISNDDELVRFGPTLYWLYPELHSRGITPLPVSNAGADSPRLYEVVSRWVQSVSARKPLLIFVDDLHWCDTPSLEALNACIRLESEARLLVLGTFRDDEVSPGSPLWRTVDEEKCRYLKLNPFDPAQVREWLQSMLGGVILSDEFTRSLYDVTGGNAFFVTEVLRDLVEQGLATVSDGNWHFPSDLGTHASVVSVDATVTRRLSRVNPATLALARVASVLGREQSFELLSAVSGLAGESLFPLIDELAERQFLFRKEQGYLFTHDRVREALYRALPSDFRQEIHRRCGEYLEQLGGEDGDRVNELAYHFGRSNHPWKAYLHARRAGDRAKSVGSDDQALQYWDDAARWLASCNVPDQEEHLFDLWWLIGINGIVLWPERAVENIKKCLVRLEQRGRPEPISAVLKGIVLAVQRLPGWLREPLLCTLAKPYPYRHTVPSGFRKYLPPHIPSWMPKIIESHVLACVASGLAGQTIEGRRLGERALALLPFKDSPLEGCVLTALCGPLQAAGHYDELEMRVARARSLLFDRDLSGQDIPMSARVGAATFSNLRVFQGYRYVPRWVDYCIWATNEIQKPDFYNQAWVNPAIWYAWTGRHDEATELVGKIAHNCRKNGAPPFPWILYLKPYLAWQRGGSDEAMAQIIQAQHYPHLERLRLAYESVWILKGHVHLSQDDPTAAEAVFAEVEERARVLGMELIAIQAWIGRGLVALHRGDTTGARAFLEVSLKRSETGLARNPLHAAIALRHLADVDRAEGDYTTAKNRFDRALAIVGSAEQDNLIEQGRLHLLHSSLEQAQGNMIAAQAALKRASACFRQIGNAHCLRLVTRYQDRHPTSASFLEQ